MATVLFPAGSTIRNLERSTRDFRSVKKRYGVTTWIQLLKLHAPTLNSKDLTQCAAYTAGDCRAAHGTLSGCHCKLGAGSATFIVPLCTAHNNKRTSGVRLVATRSFPAFRLDADDADRDLLAARLRTHVDAVVADATELLGDPPDELVEVMELLEKRLVSLLL